MFILFARRTRSISRGESERDGNGNGEGDDANSVQARIDGLWILQERHRGMEACG